jgi:uncharacterized protein (TIGR02246 family)
MLSLLALFLALQSAAEAPAQAAALEAEREAIRAADVAMARAVADRRLEGFLEMVGEDAQFFGTDVSRGREAIAKAWGPFFTDPARTLKWIPQQVEVGRSGDLGYSVGSYERVGPDAAGKPAVMVGTYVTVWRKHPDGRWRAVIDAGTPGTPRPGSQP